MSNTPKIEVRHLKKYFKTPSGLLHAVDDVSFSIEKGHTLGVVGESGEDEAAEKENAVDFPGSLCVFEPETFRVGNHS